MSTPTDIVSCDFIGPVFKTVDEAVNWWNERSVNATQPDELTKAKEEIEKLKSQIAELVKAGDVLSVLVDISEYGPEERDEWKRAVAATEEGE